MHHQRRTTSSIALEELKRRDQLESLRPFLVNEQCFPSSKDPETSPITIEELKKLVRIWKLNERRNFWKTHSERDDIVSALIQHAEQVFNYGSSSMMNNNSKSPRKVNATSAAESTSVIANNNGNNVNISPFRPSLPSDPRPSQASLRNVCGLKYFNRTVKPAELTIHSRFFAFPGTTDRVYNVVDRWRSEDFHLKDDAQGNASNGSNGNNNGSNNSNNNNNNNNGNFMSRDSSTSSKPSENGKDANNAGSASASNTSSASGSKDASRSAANAASSARNKARVQKQRNLAQHLMNYSAHTDLKKTTFSVKSVQTFINVAESDDPKTVSHCIIALSNISADPAVRTILLEINAMHKITNLVQFIRGKAAHWAAGLLFYYFSCDKESEDRIYNASSMLLQANGSAKNPQVRLIALYTLNNLMPCIDRQRVAEFILRILHSHFDEKVVFHDKQLTETYLLLMQNMAWFSNAHATLIACNMLELLEKFAVFAAKNRNADVGLSVAKILLSLLQLPEQAVHSVNAEFLHVLTVLVSCDNENTLVHALKAAVALSSVAALRRVVLLSSDLLKAISTMVASKHLVGSALSKEVAKFLSNMSLSIEELAKIHRTAIGGTQASAAPSSPSSKFSVPPATALELVEKFVSDNVHEAVFVLLKSVNTPIASKYAAIHALQNIVAFAANGSRLVSLCLDPMLKFLRETIANGMNNNSNNANGGGGIDVGAVQVLYNLACIPQCRETLVACKIHNKVLDLMIATREGAMKSAYLQILVQLSSSAQCVAELLSLDLIAKLDAQLKQQLIKCDVWRDISLMLLAIVAFARESLSQAQYASIVRVLRTICSPAAMRQACTQYVKERERDKEREKEGAFKTLSLYSNNNNNTNNNSSGNIHAPASNNTSNNSNAFDAQAFTSRMLSAHMEEILDNGANILKFVSISFDSFEEMDPVVRAVIASSAADNEEVVENISHVLYNMTCYALNIPRMLEDATYLNTMIRLMRSGKAHVQENIAHAMRTLCSAPQCVELLLRHDMLSDLVVIALLRTSSEEIKIICSEAFYNMLTHEETRLKLLQGDLWWALMRLGRTDSESVRAICIRALADLAAPLTPALLQINTQTERELGSSMTSTKSVRESESERERQTESEADRENEREKEREWQRKVQVQSQRIAALRTHHVLSFMRDLSTACAPEALPQCLRVVHNILSQFASLPPPALSLASERERENAKYASKNPALQSMRQQEMSFDNNNSSKTGGNNSSSPNGSINNSNGASNNPTNNVNVLSVSPLSAPRSPSLYASHEVVAAIRIAADALHRGTTLEVVRIALQLLLKCSQLRNEVDNVDSEFLNIDVVEILKTTRDRWTAHADCRVAVSRLLFELSKSKLVTKSVLLSELSPVLQSALEPDLSALEICENALATIKFFTYSENIPPRDIVSLPVWPLLLKIALSTESPIVLRNAATLSSLLSPSASSSSMNTPVARKMIAVPPALSAAPPQGPNTARRSNTGNSSGTGVARPRATLYLNSMGIGSTASTDAIASATGALGVVSEAALRGSQAVLFRTQGIALAMLAYCIDEQLARAPQILDSSLVQGLLRAEFVDHMWTKNNLLLVFHACSKHEKTVSAILQEESFSLLTRYVHTSIGTIRQEKAQEFGSCFLRNCALHAHFRSKLISIPHGVLVEFVREITETFTTAAVAIDLSIFFYHVATHLTSSEQFLNPKFVLDMVHKVSANPVVANSVSPLLLSGIPGAIINAAGNKPSRRRSSDRGDAAELLDVMSVNKFTVSVILNQYSFHSGVDPSFVQSMFLYLQSGAATMVPERMADEISFRNIAHEIATSMSADFVAIKESTPTSLLSFSADELCWQPVLHRDIKSQETIVLKFSSATGVFYDRLESVEALPISVFAKIVKTFDTVKDNLLHASATGPREGSGGAIVEEGDELEEEEEEEHKSVPFQQTLMLRLQIAERDEKVSVQSAQTEESEADTDVAEGEDRRDETDMQRLHATPRHQAQAKYRREGGTDDKLPSDILETSHGDAYGLDELRESPIAEMPENDEKEESPSSRSAHAANSKNGKKEEENDKAVSSRSAAPEEGESERSLTAKRSVVSLLKEEIAIARQASSDKPIALKKEESENDHYADDFLVAQASASELPKERSAAEDSLYKDDFSTNTEKAPAKKKAANANKDQEEEDAYSVNFEDDPSVKSGRFLS